MDRRENLIVCLGYVKARKGTNIVRKAGIGMSEFVKFDTAATVDKFMTRVILAH